VEVELIKNTVSEVLGCEIKEMDKDRIVMTMPITNASRQPFGLLHGGVSVVLAESCASLGTWLNINQETQAGVGIEINANHLRAKRDGIITATATPFHKGRTSMVWDIRITDEQDKLICVSRCTVAVIDRPKD
jgi:1,4-dihydroxy-2-naphthoyl-CoA hydrolase